MPAFEFVTVPRIVFGAGASARVPEFAVELGLRRILLVTGRTAARAQVLRSALEKVGMEVTLFAVSGEPTIEMAVEGVAVCSAAQCDGVIAFGGGSAVDAAKAIAALAANGGDALDYVEVIGRGRPIEQPSLPFIAIPTTAGTGSEVTKNAVLGSRVAGVKASIRSPLMLPRIAVVDPGLLTGLPKPVLAASGLDALSQLIEPFLSSAANPMTDALAREGIRRSARSLRRAFSLGLDDEAREDLAMASLFGGLCLANAGLGAVHGFAAPIGGVFAAPHGAVCAGLLVAVMEVNRAAMAAQSPEHPGLERMREIARILTGDPAGTLDAGIEWLRRLRVDLEIPALSHYGLNVGNVPDLVAKGKNASSMKKNPVVLSDRELTEILMRSL